MGKRVTLTTDEIEHIVKGLVTLQKQCGLDYAVVHAGERVYQKIIDKLNAPSKSGDTT